MTQTLEFERETLRQMCLRTWKTRRPTASKTAGGTREQNPRDQGGCVCPQAAYMASSPTKGPGGSRRKMRQGQPAWRASHLREAVSARTQVTAAQGRVCGTRTSEEVTGKDAERHHRARKPSGRQRKGPAGSGARSQSRTQPQQRGRDALRARRWGTDPHPPPSAGPRLRGYHSIPWLAAVTG